MWMYSISANLVRIIEQLYDKATSGVQMNGSIGEWFRTTVGVRQGCLLSPTLFNIFLERIMSDALEEHDGKVSIGGRNITNLRFAADIDVLAEEQQGLEALVESLDKTCTRYKMEISTEKTKLMTNSANGIQREIKVKGQKLGTVIIIFYHYNFLFSYFLFIYFYYYYLFFYFYFLFFFYFIRIIIFFTFILIFCLFFLLFIFCLNLLFFILFYILFFKKGSWKETDISKYVKKIQHKPYDSNFNLSSK